VGERSSDLSTEPHTREKQGSDKVGNDLFERGKLYEKS